MRVLRVCFAVFLLFPLPVSALAQTSITQSSPHALALLQQSLAVLTAGQSITDVTLSGTARWIAGSDNEAGAATLKAIAAGAARTDLSLPSGPRSEVVNLTGTEPAGTWSGPDGLSHAIVFHNLLTEPAWFFPAFAIGRRLVGTDYVISYVGHESHEGQGVEHISVSQTSSLQLPADGPSFQHLSQLDLFLDTATLLPVAIGFNTHPDNNVLLDLAVQIRFSDYRSVNGAQVPFHIQKFFNNNLLLDFQVQSVTPNSGLSASAFSVQ